ncbi:E1A-binding protein p400-like [Porphyrio hochstetteri]
MGDLAGIAAAAEALLPKGSAQMTTVVKGDTPPLLRGALREYQKTGMEWLAKLYKRNLNGILADEAGLGKTVQVVAFFAHLACNEGNWGPILVVSQNFNVLKWETELKCWCPALKILLYLGNPGELFKKRQVVQSFILQRSKTHLEQQLPRKYEHVLMCPLSDRQKSMYKDISSQPRTQECLRSGHSVSVLHILTQMLSVCNHPDLISPRLPRSSFVLDPLEFTTASLVLSVLQWDLWKDADRSLFDVVGMENQMTCYEAQILPKMKVSRKLIEDIYCSPPSHRLEPVKLKPNRLFTPVQYGQKPEGRTRDFSRSQLQQRVEAATVTADHREKKQRRQPLATFPDKQHRKASKMVFGPMASTAGAPVRTAQPEKLVMLQFRGKTFTLSYSQFCLLIDGQSLKHQGCHRRKRTTEGTPGQNILCE